MVRVGNPSRYRTDGRSVWAVIMVLSAGLLRSCNSATIATGDPNEIDVLDTVRALDMRQRQPQQVNASQPNAGRRSRAAVYEGIELTDIPEETRPQSIASGS